MIRGETGVALVDTGIGLHDISDPDGRIGRDAINAAGFQFLPAVTAVRQLAEFDVAANEVTDIILTHCDPDHAGGIADFPDAKVHVASEEKQSLDSGNPRYSPLQFTHGPKWVVYETNDCETLTLPSRRVHTSLDIEIRLVPLFGHTRGHCGVAIQQGECWILHVGDAYYLRGELAHKNHPIDELATARADDNELRRDSLDVLRKLTCRDEVNLTYFGYHDVTELPNGIPRLEDVS